MRRTRKILLLGAALTLLVQAAAQATVGQPRTEGPNYDRNPTLVQDGALTYMFFARSQQPCDRIDPDPLAACNPDNSQYDMYMKVSPNGGRDFGPDQLVATNPDTTTPLDFYGRTLAATRTADGTVYVFWASGGNLQQLYYVAETGPDTGVFGPPQEVNDAPMVFNVEAIAVGDEIFLYTEELRVAPPTYGIYSRSFVGGVSDAPVLVAADRNIPKAIVDNQAPGVVRLTYVDATTYPDVRVHIATSPDGRNFVEHPEPIVADGASNWDPALGQKPNGQYYLFYAPDNGDGRQRIGLTMSNDFIEWTEPHEISPGQTDGVNYWDYWPEPFVDNNQLKLFYTSERGWNQDSDGIAHIWSTPGQGGPNEL
jgi:hypothetical protein